MSAAENRRNGKAASCEVCRKAKIRCDHQRPICTRCQKRGLRCFYHPAPLTKPRSPPAYGAQHTVPLDFGPHSNVASAYDGARRASVLTNAASPSRPATSTSIPNASSPYSRSRPVEPAWPPPSPDYHGRQPQASKDEASVEELHEQRAAVTQRLLSHLRHYEFIQSLIRQYIAHAQAALIPGPIVMAFASSLTETVSRYHLNDLDNRDDGLSRLTEHVLRSTSASIDINLDLDVSGYVSMFSGEHLRLETVGVLFALSARSHLLGLAHDDDRREEFIQAMYDGTRDCLRLARRLASNNNDVMLWLAFEYNRLTTHVEGDSSPTVYRRMGDLSTYIFEFGLHGESKIVSQTPFFLQECRRKTFAAAYYLDKFVATLIDRPPRILRRYSDCEMPLDLTDDEIVTFTSEEQARMALTNEGWYPSARYVPSTWHRLRFMLGTLREEILEFQFRPSNSENNAKLRELSRRCRELFDFVPSHLRYKPECWDAGLPPTVCLMLTVMQLNYLQSDFQIHRLLEKSDPEATAIMLKVAGEVVSTVLHLGTCLNRAIFLRYDFSYIILGYGLPCAAVLATALQETIRGGAQTIPVEIGRSALIRNLAVFVSHLQSICTPSDGNYSLCVRASTAISRSLDEILEPAASIPATSSVTGPRTPASVANDGPGPFPSLQTMPSSENIGISDLDFLSGEGLDGFDLSTWVKNIDWTGAGGEWGTF